VPLDYWSAIVSIAPSSTISEIKRDIGRKSRFFIPSSIGRPRKAGGGGGRIFPYHLVRKTRMVWLSDGENNLKIVLLVSTEYTNVTDKRTDRHRTTAGEILL